MSPQAPACDCAALRADVEKLEAHCRALDAFVVRLVEQAMARDLGPRELMEHTFDMKLRVEFQSWDSANPYMGDREALPFAVEIAKRAGVDLSKRVWF